MLNTLADQGATVWLKMYNLSKKLNQAAEDLIVCYVQMRKIAFKILWKCSFNFTSVRLNTEFRRKPAMNSALSPPHLQPFWPQRKSHQIWQAMLMPSAIPFIEQESDCNYGNVRERECRGHHHCCQVAENSAKELYRGRQKYLLARNFVGRTAPNFGQTRQKRFWTIFSNYY